MIAHNDSSRLIVAVGMAALTFCLAGPVAAQNATGMPSPFPPSTPPVLMPSGAGHGGSGAGGPGTGGSGAGHGGGLGRHPRPIYPSYPFYYWPYGGLYPGMATDFVQPQPVNPEPFKPTEPPTFGRQESTKPYAPPSVEIAPGGIEIIRGPS